MSDGADFYVEDNAYFDLMRKRGYRINVYQTAFLRLCGEETGEDVASCSTYGTEAIDVIEGSSLPIKNELRIIFGVYSRL